MRSFVRRVNNEEKVKETPSVRQDGTSSHQALQYCHKGGSDNVWHYSKQRSTRCRILLCFPKRAPTVYTGKGVKKLCVLLENKNTQNVFIQCTSLCSYASSFCSFEMERIEHTTQ